MWALSRRSWPIWILVLVLLVGAWWRWSPPVWLRSPVPLFKVAGRALLAGAPWRAVVAARLGLERVPWYGAGWALWGIGVAEALGPAAAQPYLELALRLDPMGRRTWRAVWPYLLPERRVRLLLTQPAGVARLPAPLLRALPVTPPTAWPLRFPDEVAARLAERLFRARRWNWLVRWPWQRAPGPVRPWLLAAACRLEPVRCPDRLRACRADLACSQALVSGDQEIVRAIRDALAATGRMSEALTWARRAATSGRSEDVWSWTRILRRQGAVTDALRIERLHPALERER